jgi:hypothetical protein
MHAIRGSVLAIAKKCRVLCILVCMAPARDATHAGHASDPLLSRADTLHGARPPKNIFRRHRRLRVAQADLRKTAQAIQQRRPSCAHAEK